MFLLLHLKKMATLYFRDSSADVKVVTPTDGQSNLDNPTYATEYAQVQRVPQATPSTMRYQLAMYDTIEDQVTARNAPTKREPFYHVLDEAAHGGTSRSDAGSGRMNGTARPSLEEQSTRSPPEQPTLDYYEVPVKST